jgi:putative hydrolase of the HAD superfamily
MKALLCDLDDTLLDYSGGVDECWMDACETGCTSRGIDPAPLVHALASSRRWFWDDAERHRRERVNMLGAWTKIVAHAMETICVRGDGVADAVAREFAARRRARMQLFPEAIECLERFRARGIRLALVTNGDASQQRDKIARHQLAGFFDAIVIEGEFGAGKPDETVYRHALDALGIECADACMVGDHLEFDVAGPQKLGVRGVWLDRAGRGLPAGSAVLPWRIVRCLRDLADAV